jgi:hypothetical protein
MPAEESASGYRDKTVMNQALAIIDSSIGLSSQLRLVHRELINLFLGRGSVISRGAANPTDAQ